MSYAISQQRVDPRPIAVVRARMPVADVPRRFAELLGEVYTAARCSGLALDGQNIFVYRGASSEVDVEFGVGTTGPFTPIGRVVPSETPGGEIATTTHWGEYSGLGGAHHAVVAWCKANARQLTGTSWEVYGHWSDDPATRRTDVYYLLQDK
jgi:effector-binding domain-containing protein